MKGQRLPNPQRIASHHRRGWERLALTLYGREVTLQVWTRVCLWYRVAGGRPVRVVVTRDPKGRAKPRAYFCTDPDASVAAILTRYAQRWDLEVAIRNAKQSLGVEVRAPTPGDSVAIAGQRLASYSPRRDEDPYR